MDYMSEEQRGNCAKEVCAYLIQKIYDVVVLIDAKSGTYYNCVVGRSKIFMESSGSYEKEREKCYRDYIPDLDQEAMEQKTNLQRIEQELQTDDQVEFMAKIFISEGVFAWKRFSYFYYDKSRRTLLLTVEDMTKNVVEEKKQKEIINRAVTVSEQASMVKSSFLSRISHEIRIPMNAIFGMCSLAEQSCGKEKEVLDCISKIRISGQYLMELINDILYMSRIESGRLGVKNIGFDFAEWIGRICQEVEPRAKEKNIYFDTCIDSRIPGKYKGDPHKLKQVLLNLLDNALKYTSEGGRITLSVNLLSADHEGVKLAFIVQDTGCGIRPKLLEHIFEPFGDTFMEEYSSDGGTGLGLAISRNLMEMMNGNIKVESSINEGTTVTAILTLEVTDQALVEKKDSFFVEAEQKNEKDVEMNQYNFTGKHFLLAEDHKLNAEVVIRLLERRGAKVELATNGLKALEEYLIKPDEYYDAILMDLKMPVMDGLHAAYNIRQLGKKDARTIPIVALTANVFEEDAKKSREVGMDAHLAKPIYPGRMFRILDTLMKRKNER